jgi:p-methyltransferase
MGTSKHLDCVVIGYNEQPFEEYETLLREWGEDSEPYRDLKFSFVNLGGRKLDYVSLLNQAWELAHNNYQKVGGRREFESGDIPNLASVYLTWFLRKRGMEAKYINLFQLEKAKLETYLADNPYCVAITTTFYLLNFPVNEIVEFIRRRNSRVKIVVGGPLIANHLRNYSGEILEEMLQDMGADYYVDDSQGEMTLWRVVECLRNKGEIGSVPNLIYFSDGKMIRTQIAPENNSLDDNDINWAGFPNNSDSDGA